MSVKLKYGNNNRGSGNGTAVRGNRNRQRGSRGFISTGLLRIAAVVLLGIALVGGAVFAYLYNHYEHVVDDRFKKGPLFSSVSQIYAAPREVRPGQKLTAEMIAAELRRAGYNSNSRLGTFELRGDSSIFIKPGTESFHATDGATINSANGVIQSITAESGAALSAYSLEPQLITSLSDESNRTKRRVVTYDQIPPHLVQAVTAIEDRDFFNHGGINYLRTIKCAVHDILAGRKDCGGSTLTQQVARTFFLTRDKKISRKIAEAMITFQLEHRFSKPEIFSMYVNAMNLVRRGSYEINGVGEASHVLFAKDLRQLDLAQLATLAALFQNPSYRNPYRHPDRAMERRNLVLDSMVETGAITASEASRAKAEPLGVTQSNADAGEAPYFVDLVHDQIVKRIGDQDIAHQDLRIYTSLDPDLQRIAAEAVANGMKNVDELVRRLHRRKGETEPTGPITYPQVSLVALNPHTGQILALVGGRNYEVSQFNHATSNRPTGSTFKPFVYATAYNTSLQGLSLGSPVSTEETADDGSPAPAPSSGVFTALTQLNDEAASYTDGKGGTYIPRNLLSGYRGNVTAAYALAHSLNAATIQLGQMVGFDNVAALARASGLTSARGTPSVAIGSYSSTPIDVAGAYTVFANGGVHLTPWMLSSVRNANGDIVSDYPPEAKQVLDPRAAYLTQSLLEGVINYGTAIKVRALGFSAPAAGKTGTDHDAWFAGYTSNLICIIWIGNDDYTDIKLQGADAAAPMWAEFMKKATQLPQYSDVKPFTAPSGVTTTRIDKTTNLLADPSCPGNVLTVAFLDGTAPVNSCSHMNENPQNIFQKIFGLGGGNSNPNPSTPSSTPSSTSQPAPIQRATVPLPSNPPANSAPSAPQQPEPPKKKNLFQKLFGHKNNPQDQPQ